ncbi:MAG: hypothetical protein WC442_00930 [Candidatus Omnitrophota bacterium]
MEKKLLGYILILQIVILIFLGYSLLVSENRYKSFQQATDKNVNEYKKQFDEQIKVYQEQMNQYEEQLNKRREEYNKKMEEYNKQLDEFNKNIQINR